MDDKQSTIRKAAILVAAVDGRTAELLLAQMGTAEAAAVRRAAAALDDIPAEEREAVLSEFRELTGERLAEPTAPKQAPRAVPRRFVPPAGPAGIDLCGPQANLLHSSPNSEESGEHQNSPTGRPGLRQAGNETLAEFLSGEQPQTIAVVFTRLPPHQAAEVLRRLPDALQIEVVERLATTDQADPQVLRDIEQGLESWLANQTRRGRREGAGISTATRLLEAASYDLRQSVLSHLARRDTALARRLAASPLRPTAEPHSVSLTFDDLLQADDTILATVIAAADRHLATLALAGCNKNVVRRLERRMPGSDWQLLRSNIENLGPTRLSDVETAQQQIVRLALDLEAEVKIDLSAIRPVDVTA
ncbi:MAG: hypothetical protein K8T91_23455 [Planctomycetes bacterium]|nr:hypothetical protein [Planctomycetota bacterium]